MLTTRTATVADIPLIRELAMQTWPLTYIPIIGEQQVAYMLDLFYDPAALTRQITEQQHTFLLCYNSDVPVAFASWSLIGNGVYKLHKLYLLPAQQGTGIGRYIITHILTTLRALQAQELQLNVNIHNATAIAFYTRSGFTHLRNENIDIGNNYFMNDHVLTMSI